MKKANKKLKVDKSKIVDMDGIEIVQSPMYINQKVELNKSNNDTKRKHIDFDL